MAEEWPDSRQLRLLVDAIDTGIQRVSYSGGTDSTGEADPSHGTLLNENNRDAESIIGTINRPILLVLFGGPLGLNTSQDDFREQLLVDSQKYQDTAFIKAFRDGHWLILERVEHIDESRVCVLRAIRNWMNSGSMSSVTNAQISMNKNFRLFVTISTPVTEISAAAQQALASAFVVHFNILPKRLESHWIRSLKMEVTDSVFMNGFAETNHRNVVAVAQAMVSTNYKPSFLVEELGARHTDKQVCEVDLVHVRDWITQILNCSSILALVTGNTAYFLRTLKQEVGSANKVRYICITGKETTSILESFKWHFSGACSLEQVLVIDFLSDPSPEAAATIREWYDDCFSSESSPLSRLQLILMASDVSNSDKDFFNLENSLPFVRAHVPVDPSHSSACELAAAFTWPNLFDVADLGKALAQCQADDNSGPNPLLESEMKLFELLEKNYEMLVQLNGADFGGLQAAQFNRPLAALVCYALIADIPLLLQGPPGTSKTFTVTQFARARTQSSGTLVTVSHSRDTTIADYIGQSVAGLRNRTDGPLIDALRNGYCFLADELNLASPLVIATLLPVLMARARDTVYFADIPDGILRNPDFRMFATQNPVSGYSQFGRSTLPECASSYFLRLRSCSLSTECLHSMVKIELERGGSPPLSTVIMDSLAHRMVCIYKSMSEIHSNRSDVATSISVRTLISWARLIRSDHRFGSLSSVVLPEWFDEAAATMILCPHEPETQIQLIDALSSHIPGLATRMPTLNSESMCIRASTTLGQPLLLMGPGAGKTISLRRSECISYCCTGDTTIEDLLGRYELSPTETGGPRMSFKPGPVWVAAHDGARLFILSIETLKGAVLEQLHDFLEYPNSNPRFPGDIGGDAGSRQGVRYDSDRGIQTSISRGFHIVATANVLNSSQISPALRSRFIQCWLPNLDWSPFAERYLKACGKNGLPLSQLRSFFNSLDLKPKDQAFWCELIEDPYTFPHFLNAYRHLDDCNAQVTVHPGQANGSIYLAASLFLTDSTFAALQRADEHRPDLDIPLPEPSETSLLWIPPWERWYRRFSIAMLARRPLLTIGPPGTGKTEFIEESIRQLQGKCADKATLRFGKYCCSSSTAWEDIEAILSKSSIAFLDEINLAPPGVLLALSGWINAHYEVGTEPPLLLAAMNPENGGIPEELRRLFTHTHIAAYSTPDLISVGVQVLNGISPSLWGDTTTAESDVTRLLAIDREAGIRKVFKWGKVVNERLVRHLSNSGKLTEDTVEETKAIATVLVNTALLNQSAPLEAFRRAWKSHASTAEPFLRPVAATEEALRCGFSVLLHGPSDSGKTFTACRALDSVCGVHGFSHVYLPPDCDGEELIIRLALESGEIVARPTDLLAKAVQYREPSQTSKYGFLFEEVDCLFVPAFDRVHDLFDPLSPSLSITGLSERVRSVPPAKSAHLLNILNSSKNQPIPCNALRFVFTAESLDQQVLTAGILDRVFVITTDTYRRNAIFLESTIDGVALPVAIRKNLNLESVTTDNISCFLDALANLIDLAIKPLSWITAVVGILGTNPGLSKQLDLLRVFSQVPTLSEDLFRQGTVTVTHRNLSIPFRKLLTGRFSSLFHDAHTFLFQ